MSLEKVPPALTERRQWIVWKTIVRDGQPTKLPFQAKGGTAAKSNDASTWAAFDEARATFERGGYSGVGFVFSKDDGFCGIDLDGCRNPETGEFAEWARAILKRFDSYSEVSPSKTGAKIFVRGKTPWGTGKKFPVDGAPKVCDKEPAIEVYDQGRYFAVTGLRLGAVSTDVEPRQDALDWLAKEHGPKDAPALAVDWQSDSAVVERARKYLGKLPPSVSGQGGHNAAFHAACVLVIDFGLSEPQAYGLLTEWNLACQPPWSEKDLRRKVSEAAKQPGERNRLRNAKQENWDRIKIPSYQAPREVRHVEVHKTTLEEASFARLDQVAKGTDRFLETGIPDLDYALGGGVEPGEMIIVAARPSHGKSAVALQIVHHFTAQGYPAVMISEEMSALALGKRAIQFATEVPREHWRHSVNEVRGHLHDHFSSRAKCVIVESCRSVYVAEEQIREAVEREHAKLAVVDYAQLLVGNGKTRFEQISEACAVLRKVTNETKVVMVALCQMNRSIEGRREFAPLPSDLKETGQFEQDADVIVFLCWPHRLDSRRPPSEYQFFVVKNRNREINCPAFKCVFHPSRQMLVSERPTSRPEPRQSAPLSAWDATFNPDNYEYPGAFG